MRSHGKPLPQRLERQAHGYRNHNIPPTEISMGTSIRVKTTSRIIEKLLKTQCGQVWERKTPSGLGHMGVLKFFEFYLQELYQVFTVSTRRKKGTVLKYTKVFCSSLKGLLTGKTIFPDHNLLGLHQSLKSLDMGYTNSNAPQHSSSILSHQTRQGKE